jgi:hypothetical protein
LGGGRIGRGLERGGGKGSDGSFENIKMVFLSLVFASMKQQKEKS